MSYILDALKKIEHEKLKKSKPDGRISIAGDLFNERKQPAAGGGIWKVVALVAAVALVTVAGTWFALKGNARKSAAVIIRQAVPPTPPAPVSPPAAAPAPTAVPIPAPVPAPVAIQPKTIPAPAPPETKVAALPAAPVKKATAGHKKTPPREVRHSKKISKPQPSTSVQKQPVQAVQAPADIKLSGIAWQDERTTRRAVINGFLLKEGAVVQGATITEIRADKVRFSSGAGQFEIKLDAIMPVEAK